DLLTDRVVDATKRTTNTEEVFRHLCGHHVAVVPLSYRNEGIRLSKADAGKNILIDRVSCVSAALELRWQPLEGVGPNINHGNVVPVAVKPRRKCLAESPAAHDHNLHRLTIPGLAPCIQRPGTARV